MQDNAMNHMGFWEAWSNVPDEAKKPITGGRLAGMTDINPMWRYYMLTKQFGPCGDGWYYTIDKAWQELIGNEILCFVQASLFVKINDSDGKHEYSKPIQGFGGSKLLALEKEKLRPSDEGYKMALTDALSVCCKSLGIGANVYWLKGASWMDLSKYDTRPQDDIDTPEEQPKPPMANERARERVSLVRKFKETFMMDDDGFIALRQELIEAGAVVDKASADMNDDEFEAMMFVMEAEAQKRMPAA